MRLTIPNLCFLTSSIPIEFCTDGTITRLGPEDQNHATADQILVLTWLHVGLFNLKSIPTISLFDTIDLPDDFHVPEIYDGTQDLQGKNILILMLNGWGDMILIQPALRAFYRKNVSDGNPPRITIGCNWIHNFPYPDDPYIHHVCPNIMTLKELCNFDIIVNLIPANYQRLSHLSMRDMYLQIMKLDDEYGGRDAPALQPNPQRVDKIKPILDDLRKKTGKKLLSVNWRSRFPHKNASVAFFLKIAEELSHVYQAVLFKDEQDSLIMQKEIDESKAPVMNLSSHIHDYHDTTAALSLVDAFVSVDTGIVHAAGAMGIPGVALFGPFPPQTHVADYSSIMAIRAPYRGKNCQEPCLETCRGCAEVDYVPDRVSPCFEAIEVDQVIQALNEITNHCHGVDKL
ncbi:MAG: lipopolysaccharide heptosyltransferase family protein [Porphyromonadaceae bacterium]|nr:MAG: lipopolysaccharide heptosyltransferase family protein [Porphyromonadaceae bacterium]